MLLKLDQIFLTDIRGHLTQLPRPLAASAKLVQLSLSEKCPLRNESCPVCKSLFLTGGKHSEIVSLPHPRVVNVPLTCHELGSVFGREPGQNCTVEIQEDQ